MMQRCFAPRRLIRTNSLWLTRNMCVVKQKDYQISSKHGESDSESSLQHPASRGSNDFSLSDVPEELRLGVSRSDIEVKFPFLRGKDTDHDENIIEAPYGLMRFDKKPLNTKDKEKERKLDSYQLQMQSSSEIAGKFKTVSGGVEIEHDLGVFDSQYFVETNPNIKEATVKNEVDISEDSSVYNEVLERDAHKTEENFATSYHTIIARNEGKHTRAKSQVKHKEPNVPLQSENLFDSEYFPDMDRTDEQNSKTEKKVEIEPANIFEEQFFPNEESSTPKSSINEVVDHYMLQDRGAKIEKSLTDDIHLAESSTNVGGLSKVLKPISSNDANFFDNEYFGSVNDSNIPVQEPPSLPQKNIPQESIPLSKITAPSKKKQITYEEREEDIVVMPQTKRQLKRKTQPIANVENPKTAYDLAIKIRMEAKKGEKEKKDQESGSKYHINNRAGTLFNSL